MNWIELNWIELNWIEWNGIENNTIEKKWEIENYVETGNYLDYAGHAEVGGGETELECVLGAALLAEHNMVLVQQDVSSLLSIPKIEV